MSPYFSPVYIKIAYYTYNYTYILINKITLNIYIF
nr:MAG TPA: hypothetical protein [Caudoviricetes sp.]